MHNMIMLINFDSKHNFSGIEIFEIQALTVIPTVAGILIIVRLHNVNMECI